ncbi:MAG: sulfotransferase [Gammaproteobacteria bacterium]|nr:sulfotransferase [Gammaproteobacteria bacterium]MCF6230077.1 sulfotransferase [Gammaproteobacteria bacterium]
MVAQVDARYIKKRPTKLYSRLVSYLLFEGRPLTTRGQWINPLLSASFSLYKRLPQLKTADNPVFILGTGRSGTTILGIVLSMHKDVGFLNEPKALWHAIHPNEDLIGSYSRKSASYYLNASDVDELMKRNAHRLFGAYLTATFSKRVVDKYPELIFRVPFVKSLFPDAKFLFLVRNGWDTCHSIEGWSARLGKQKNGEIHDWWGVNNRKWNLLLEQVVSQHEDLVSYVGDMKQWTNHVDMAAVEWIVTMREGLQLERRYPGHVLRVKYEELCVSAQSELKKIIDFCQLRQDEVFSQYAQQTLHLTPPKSPFPLAENIQEPFTQTMRQLGYAS